MGHIFQLLDGGILQWNAWQIIGYTLLTTHLAIVAVTVYLHRCQAHHALELHSAVAHVFRFWLWLSTGMVTREWVAVHRKHHAHCEKAGDPHSPQLFGIRQVLFHGAELYRREARVAATLQRYGAGTPDDWMERHVYSRYTWQGVGLLLVADVLMFGVIGATVWSVQMLWIPVCAAGIINGLGHYIGYRNFDGPHAATNIVPVGILIGGEELHNNHHTFPTSAKLAARWFELDIGWCYIRLLQALGLAHVRAVLPRPPVAGRQLPLTDRTVAGVGACRHHIMRSFGIMMVRALREELHGESGGRIDARARRQAERLLRREPAYLSDTEKQALAALVSRYEWLAHVQRMREELSQLWECRLASPQELLARLIDWCDRAERSGIRALRNFSLGLHAYG
jgi:stearoyl-CoA desaturase (delta-9 desaturase)